LRNQQKTYKLKIKKILISQPKPNTDKSPYFDLEDKHKVKLDFKQFIQVEGVTAKEFRGYKVNILDHTAVIFTSRTAIDHFFRIAEESRVAVPDTMKYFCTSESIAVYLQKYIVYRKRKIFFGQKRFADLMEVLVKHIDETFLVPVSDVHKDEISILLDKNKIKYTKATFYRTVASDLSDITVNDYDVLVFYSPSGISSLFTNFPKFEQNSTRVATFGPNTAKAAEEAGIRVDLKVPSPEFPSMTMALDSFITTEAKKTK
jgi:uroporphyrinogen-III synthase